MAKRAFRKPENTAPNPATRWENSLAPTYATLIDGFNAEMTVQEMFNYLGVNQMRADLRQEPVIIPKKIANIKIGSFTPDIFAHEDFQDFWKTPVTSYHLAHHHEKLFFALNQDKDVHQIQRERAGFHVDTVRPDLETLARLAQMQYLGFNLRMSELTSKNMMARLEKLKDPTEYRHIRMIAKQFKVELPEKIPEFSIVHQETAIKDFGSALEKAYYRTGKPKDVEAFLKNPDAYGVNGVNDMMRTMIRLPDDRSKQFDNYVAVRDLLSVAVLSGELGMLGSEITDQVLYPESDRPSDLNPVLMIKGDMYHAGPVMNGKGTIITSRVEAQVVIMPDYAIAATHDMYKSSRHKDAADDFKAAMDDARVNVFESFLSPEIIERRHAFLKSGRVQNDFLGQYLFAKTNMFDITHHSGRIRHNAITRAFSEFPHDKVSLAEMTENATAITLGNMRNGDVVHSTLKAMIKSPAA